MAPIDSGFYIQIRPKGRTAGPIQELTQRHRDYLRWVAPVHGAFPVTALLSGPEAGLNGVIDHLSGHEQCAEVMVSPWLCPKGLPVLNRLKPYEAIVAADKVTRQAVMELRIPRSGNGAIHDLAGRLTEFEGVRFATVLWDHRVLLVVEDPDDGKLALTADAVYNAAANRAATVSVTLCVLPSVRPEPK
jgi:hypothetical protein